LFTARLSDIKPQEIDDRLAVAARRACNSAAMRTTPASSRAGNQLFIAELFTDIFAHDTSETDCSSTRRRRFVIGYAARFTKRSKKIHRNYSCWNFILRSKVFHMLSHSQ
jgi:hypothetical protein